MRTTFPETYVHWSSEQKFFDSKTFCTQIFLIHIFLLNPKYFWTKKFLAPNILWSQIILDTKNFQPKIFPRFFSFQICGQRGCCIWSLWWQNCCTSSYSMRTLHSRSPKLPGLGIHVHAFHTIQTKDWSPEKDKNLTKYCTMGDETWWGLRSHAYQGPEVFGSGCVMSSWNMTTYNNFVTRVTKCNSPFGDDMQKFWQKSKKLSEI